MISREFELALSGAIVGLYTQERFYAELLLSMNRFISKTAVPTLGVCIKDNIHLYINPDYFMQLTPEQRIAALIHECKHIMNDHILRGKELEPEVYDNKNKDIVDQFINSEKHKLINIAADCSINPQIQNIHPDWIVPDKFNLPSGGLMEWYVDQLKNNKKAKNLTHFDDHSIWTQSEGDKEELKAKIKDAINKSAKRTVNGGGTVSGDLQLEIDRINYVPRDWKGDLRRFAARTQETIVRESRKKRNRRYGIAIPGKLKDERLHIGLAVDTSGSINDEMLNQFFAEITNIAKYAKVTVVEADVEVKNSYEFNPRKKYKVSGRGGTAYQPALDYFTDETDVDGVIYFGDMDNYDGEKLKKPKYPVMWAIVGQQNPPATWGSTTKIVVDKK